MCKKDKEKKDGRTGENKYSEIRKGDRFNRNEKEGWRHIIDKSKYSDGPGDNIYVFG
jgi:hypothetical protein